MTEGRAFDDNQYRDQVDAVKHIDNPDTLQALAENASPEGQRAVSERLRQLGK